MRDAHSRVYFSLFKILNRLSANFYIVWKLDKGETPLLTERFDKFIEFQSIIHRFQFETIYPQGFGHGSNRDFIYNFIFQSMPFEYVGSPSSKSVK